MNKSATWSPYASHRRANSCRCRIARSATESRRCRPKERTVRADNADRHDAGKPTDQSDRRSPPGDGSVLFEEELAQIQQSNVPFTDDISVWSRHWMEAQLRLSPTMADKRAAILVHVERARRVEKIAVEQAKAGNCLDVRFAQGEIFPA